MTNVVQNVSIVSVLACVCTHPHRAASIAVDSNLVVPTPECGHLDHTVVFRRGQASLGKTEAVMCKTNRKVCWKVCYSCYTYFKPTFSALHNQAGFQTRHLTNTVVSIIYCKTLCAPSCVPFSFRFHTSSSQIRAVAAGSFDKSLPVLFFVADCQTEKFTASYLCQQLKLSRNDQVIFCT